MVSENFNYNHETRVIKLNPGNMYRENINIQNHNKNNKK